MKRWLTLALVCAAVLPCLAQSQSYPSRQVRIVCSVPPGGLQDSIARLVAQRMSEAFGQPVIVENRPGANAIIAAESVARAAPDGHTLLMGTDASISINPHLYRKLSYDPQKDFAPITQVAQFFEAMYVGIELPVSTVKEFIDYARARPGKLNYGSYGLGSTAHLITVGLERRSDIRMVHIPYKGGAEAMQALMTGQIQTIITAIGLGTPLVQAGKIKMLAIAGPKRVAQLPNVPTLAEGGLPDFESRIWYGLMAPAGTPAEAINRIAETAARFVKSPAFAEKFAAIASLEAVGSTPAEFAAFLKADREKYGRIIQAANLQLD